MAESVQTDYRRNMNPFEPGQIANGRQCQIESARLATTGYLATLPFGYAVGWVDGPADSLTNDNVTNGLNVAAGRYFLKGHVCARHFTAASGTATNFAGVAVKNVALPGDNTPVDTYNEADLVSIGSEGDFVVVCKENVTNRSAVYIASNSAPDADRGMFGATGSNRIKVPGAIYMSDSTIVRPYNSNTSIRLAVVRIRQQPREQ